MKHAILMKIINGEIFFSPIGKHPQKIVILELAQAVVPELIIITS